MLAGFGAVCLVLVGWYALRSPVADLAARWPDPARLAMLSPYSGPAAATPAIDDYSMHLPAIEPVRPRVPRPSEEVVTGGWRVSAILISGNQPIAIIDDQQVRPGSRLADGTVVERIEPTQVIVRDVLGRSHTLRVANGV